MPTYRIQGISKENGIAAGNLIIAYKANRDDMVSFGEELGRATASEATGIWTIDFLDWDSTIMVVALDLTPDVKYAAQVKDWVLGVLQVTEPGPVNEWDPDYELVSLQLHGDEATIYDSSRYEWVATESGSPENNSTQVKVGDNSLVVTTGNSISYEINEVTDFGTGDFTIEFWVYFDSSTNTYGDVVYLSETSPPVSRLIRTSNIGFGYHLQFASDFASSSTIWHPNLTQATMVGKWTHVVLQRELSDCTVYIDGVKQMLAQGTSSSYVYSSYTDTTDYGASAGIVTIGNALNIRIDELRITHKAKYSGDFTPSTDLFKNSRYEPGTEPPLLDPYFLDTVALLHFEETPLIDETNTGTWTLESTASLGSPGQFGNSALLLADGTEVSQSSGRAIHLDGDFTVEGFYYFDDVLANQGLFHQGTMPSASDRMQMQIESTGGVYCRHISPAGTHFEQEYTSCISALTWHHIAWTRQDDVGYFFVDGIMLGSFPYTGTPTHADITMVGAASAASAHQSMRGKVDEFRMTTACRYTTNFTVPTEAYPDSKWGVVGDPVVTPQEEDPFFEHVVFLSHCERDHGQAFIFDEITQTNSSTVTGSPYITADDYKFGCGSAYFTTGSDYIDFPMFKEFQLRDQDFCVEFWIKAHASETGFATVFGRWEGSGNISWGIGIDWTTGQASFNYSTSGSYQVGNQAVSALSVCTVDTWHHIAGVRHGDDLKIYVNGVGGVVEDVTGLTFADVTNTLRIGGQVANSQYFNGWMDELRITVGVPRYADNFLVPTKPFPDSRFEPGTEPPTYDPYFEEVTSLHEVVNDVLDDISGHVWTAQGGVSKTTQTGPYGTSEEVYDLTSGTIHGRFDTPYHETHDLKSGDWTVELWYKPTNFTGEFANIYGKRANSGLWGQTYIQHVSEHIYFNVAYTGSSGLGQNFAGALTLGEWNHIAFCRKHDTVYCFIDGVLLGTNNTTAAVVLYDNSSVGVSLGGVTSGNSSNRKAEGYITGFRITKGTARYVKDFALPTQPLPLISYDPEEAIPSVTVPQAEDEHFHKVAALFTGEKNLENFGNVGQFTQLNTPSISKAGFINNRASSILFSGVSRDALLATDAAADWKWMHRLESTYTIEAWVNVSGFDGSGFVLADTGGLATASIGASFGAGADGALSFLIGKGTPGTYAVRLDGTAGDLAIGVWNHMCVVKQGPLVRMYLNGVLKDTDVMVGESVSDPLNPLAIGRSQNYTNFDFDGHMEDFRLTRDVARYCESYEIPNALPTKGFVCGYKATVDPYYNHVVSLLNFETQYDGQVGDARPNRWGNNGNATVFAERLVLDGVNDNAKMVDVQEFRDTFNGVGGVKHWTIEGKFTPADDTTQQVWIGWQGYNSGGINIWQRGVDPTVLALGGGDSSGSWDYFVETPAGTIVAGETYEVAITRSGDDYLLHVNGVFIGQDTSSVLLTLGGGGIILGEAGGGLTGDYNGTVHRFRMTNGVARYGAEDYVVESGDSYPTQAYDPLEDLGPVEVPVALDPYFSQVVSHVAFDGKDGDTAVSDLITGVTWVLNGTSDLSTTEQVFGTTSVHNQVNGKLVAQGLPDIGYRDFTIEGWFKGIVTTGNRYIFDTRASAGDPAGICILTDTDGSSLVYYVGGTTLGASATNLVNDGLWHHVAVCRENGYNRMFIDGVQTEADFFHWPYLKEAVTGFILGGTWSDPAYNLQGYFDDWRITLACRYTEDFTLPVSANPATQFQVGKEATIVDEHYYQVKALLNFDGVRDDTVFADRSYAAENLWDGIGNTFLDDAEYRFGNGSAYFDGLSDYIDSYREEGIQFGEGEFTIEYWIKAGPDGDSSQDIHIDFRVADGAYPCLYKHATDRFVHYYVNGGDRIVGTTALTVAKGWTHVAICRRQGITRLFVDGQKEGADYSDSNDYGCRDFGPRLGANFLGTDKLQGRIDGVRITMAARYTASFNLPDSAPPEFEYDACENISGGPPANVAVELDPYMSDVVALVEFNIAIDDHVPGNHWALEGGATLTTAQKLFSDKSLLADATGEWATLRGAEVHRMNKNFTLEFWFHPSDLNADRGLFFAGVLGSDNDLIQIITTGSGVLKFEVVDSGAPLCTLTSGTSAYQSSDWNHIAITHDDATAEMWVNGVSVGTAAWTADYTKATDMWLGMARSSSTNQHLNGYVGPMRLTQAVRYTEAFPPPVEMFPTTRFEPYTEPTILDPHWGNVKLLLNGGHPEAEATIVDSSSYGLTGAITGTVGYDRTLPNLADTSILNGTNGRVDYLGFTLGDTWTVEMFYRVTTGNGGYLMSNRGGDTGNEWVVIADANYLTLWADGSNRVSETRPAYDEWHHVAVTWDGTELTMWLNGVDTGSYAPASPTWEDNLYIAGYSGGTGSLVGSYEGVRVTNNVVRYGKPFTPPNKLFYAGEYDENEDVDKVEPKDKYFDDVVLLLDFSEGEGGTAPVNKITSLEGTLIGAAVVSETDSRFSNTPSLYCPAGSNGLQIPNTDWAGLGDGDYTFECWYKPSAAQQGNARIFQTVDGDIVSGLSIGPVTSDETSISVYYSTNNSAWPNGFILTSTGVITLDQWNHLAVVRVGTITLCFVNGRIEGMGTFVGTPYWNTTWNTSIGGQASGIARSIAGYMADVRITLKAKYTREFRPPTSPLPQVPGTSSYLHDEYLSILDLADKKVLSLINLDEGYGNTVQDAKFQTWTTVNDAHVRSFPEISFDGSSDYLQNNHILDFANEFNGSSSSHWTIEFRYRVGSVAGEQYLIDWRPDGLGKGLVVTQPSASPTKIQLDIGDSTAGFEGTVTSFFEVSVGEEVEVAVTRDGDDYYLHVDGVYQGKATTAVTLDLGTGGLRFGSDRSSTAGTSLLGEILRARFTGDGSRYLENKGYEVEKVSRSTSLSYFGPEDIAVLPFDGADGDTFTEDLLGNQWEFNGTASISDTGPPTWKTTSLQTISNGDYIKSNDVPDLGTGDFTLEFWWASISNTGTSVLFDFRDSSSSTTAFSLYYTATSLLFRYNLADRITTSSNSRDDAWHHIAVTRHNGVTRMFIDGVKEGVDYADTADYAMTSSGMVIGSNSVDNLQGAAGMFSDFVITKGEARYLADFTAPQAPRTSQLPIAADPYTASLLHCEGQDTDTFTRDSISGPVWDFIGPAQVSNASSKFGGTSLYIPSNSAVQCTNLPDIGFRDFTIEFWIYFPSSQSAQQTLFDFRKSPGDTGGVICFINGADNRAQYYTGGGVRIVTSTALEDSVWHHIAAVRKNDVVTMYVDGVAEGGTYFHPNELTFGATYGFRWGAASDGNAANSAQGYYDDCRITMGKARYTSNFVPPSLPFSDEETLYDLRARSL